MHDRFASRRNEADGETTIRSSGASGSGSSGAGGRSNLAQNVRQAAETALSQAKQAMDQWMREAMRLYGAVEASAEVAQSGRARRRLRGRWCFGL